MEEIVYRCCNQKRILWNGMSGTAEKEEAEFGHGFGHAIEKIVVPGPLHGRRWPWVCIAAEVGETRID